MNIRKILIFLVFFVLGQPYLVFALQDKISLEDEKYFAANKILENFYNHYDSTAENVKAKEAAWQMLQDYKNDPYFYDLWAFTEFVLISHELGIKIDEQKDISKSKTYSERIQNYHRIVDTGIALTENKSDYKSLMLRASLLFDKARFVAKFEGGLSGLRRADKDSADGINIVAKIVPEEKNFCPAYLFLGIASFGLAAKTEPWSLDRLIVRAGSWMYDALYNFDEDVFDKAKSLKLLENVYNCKSRDVWVEKFWLESAFFLAGAYQNYRKDLKISEELKVLEDKELALLNRLANLFPLNQDISKKLELASLRARILKNFLQSKK